MDYKVRCCDVSKLMLRCCDYGKCVYMRKVALHVLHVENNNEQEHNNIWEIKQFSFTIVLHPPHEQLGCN